MIAVMYGPIENLFENARGLVVRAGETLFHTGDRIHDIYLVTDGQIDLVRYSRAGSRMVLNRARSGQVLAEASAYSDKYHCDATAVVDSKVMALAAAEFRKRLDADHRLAGAWAAKLARSLQAARLNSEIRSLKTVSERLDAWLSDERQLPPKGQWQLLAQTLGVSREALYRELAKRQRS